MSETIKDRIISKLGGVGVVARICGVTAGAVSQWKLIPSKHQGVLLNAARQNSIDVDASDFFPEQVKSKKPKR